MRSKQQGFEGKKASDGAGLSNAIRQLEPRSEPLDTDESPSAKKLKIADSDVIVLGATRSSKGNCVPPLMRHHVRSPSRAIATSGMSLRSALKQSSQQQAELTQAQNSTQSSPYASDRDSRVSKNASFSKFARKFTYVAATTDRHTSKPDNTVRTYIRILGENRASSPPKSHEFEILRVQELNTRTGATAKSPKDTSYQQLTAELTRKLKFNKWVHTAYFVNRPPVALANTIRPQLIRIEDEDELAAVIDVGWDQNALHICFDTMRAVAVLKEQRESPICLMCVLSKDKAANILQSGRGLQLRERDKKPPK